MDEIQKYLHYTFDVLSGIMVRGDDVERMAEARDVLRKAYKIYSDSISEKNEVKTDNG